MGPLLQIRWLNAFTWSKVTRFTKLPTWADLAREAADLFKIPQDRVNVAIVEEETEPVFFTNQEQLDRFFEKLDKSKTVKLVVQDSNHPDRECGLRFMLTSINTLTSPISHGSVPPFISTGITYLFLLYINQLQSL